MLFVGLDGGDWELLDQLMARGAMPNLAGLVKGGFRGVLNSEHPPLSPLVWTTMMTGRGPLDHGILDFVHTDLASGVKEPITSDERRVPAVWNIASWGGRKVAVFGLWATFPAEPVAGLLVSDRLFSFLFLQHESPPGAVWPPTRVDDARAALARAEARVDFGAVRAYLPWLDRPTYDAATRAQDPYADPVGALRRILVETAVYDELATAELATEAPDLAIVYLQGTDSIGHVFAPFAPPRQPSVSARDFERYNGVPERYFAAVDGLLGRYRDLAAARGAVLMLASDHGFLWGDGRPTALSSFATATAAKWHRRQGIYLLSGPGVVPGHGEGGVRQVAATLLALLGLPPGRELGGPALPGVPASDQGRAVDYAGYYRRAVPRTLTSRELASAREDLAKLQALGYLGAGDLASTAKPTTSRSVGSFNNEGLIRKEQGDTSGAIAAFEQAIALDPKASSALWNLSDLLHGQNRDLEQADRLLLRALAAGLPDGDKFLIGRAIGYQRGGDLARATRLLDGAVVARAEVPALWLFRGRYHIESGDCAGALVDFERAIRLAPDHAEAFASAGLAAACLGRRADAVGYLRRSLAIDSAQPQVRQALAGLE